MFMPKLGTMHLRNRLAFSRVVTAFLFLIFCGFLTAQTSSAPSQSNQTTVLQGQVQQPSQAPPPQTSPSSQTSANPPAAQSTATPQDQTSRVAGEAPTNDNGVFVFHAEAQEVTLHATVVDERNRLVTNL